MDRIGGGVEEGARGVGPLPIALRRTGAEAEWARAVEWLEARAPRVAPRKEEPRRPGWGRAPEAVGAALVLLGLLVGVGHRPESPVPRPVAPAVEREARALRLANEASAEELQVAGLSRAVAERVVAHRPYPTWGALGRVRGVGPATERRIRRAALERKRIR